MSWFGELAAHHAVLRTLIERCTELADDLDTGLDRAAALADEVTRLRIAFVTHARFEEEQLRPNRLASNAFEPVRTDRHLDTETAMLREVVATIRAHLDAEDRSLLR